MTLTNNNTYGSGTVINAGILQVGAGGASGTLGFGPVTDNAKLIINRTGTLALGTVTGSGSLTSLSNATVTLRGAKAVSRRCGSGSRNFWCGLVRLYRFAECGGNLTIASNVTRC